MPRKRTATDNNGKGKAASKKKAKTKTATTAPSQLRVVDPDLEDTTALGVLKALDEHLRTKRVQKFLATWCPKGLNTTEENVPGIRIINGNRFEIFVRAKDKPTDAFEQLVQDLIDETTTSADTQQSTEETSGEAPKEENDSSVLANKTVDEIRKILLDYATHQAERDDRIGKEKYTFDNFSLLVNFKKCDEQFPHIDLLSPNVQCGLMLTDKSPATVAYHTPQKIETVQDIKKHLWKDLPSEVATAIGGDEHLNRLLKQFGSTLYPKNDLLEEAPAKKIQKVSPRVPPHPARIGPARRSEVCRVPVRLVLFGLAQQRRRVRGQVVRSRHAVFRTPLGGRYPDAALSSLGGGRTKVPGPSLGRRHSNLQEFVPPFGRRSHEKILQRLGMGTVRQGW